MEEETTNNVTPEELFKRLGIKDSRRAQYELIDRIVYDLQDLETWIMARVADEATRDRLLTHVLAIGDQAAALLLAFEDMVPDDDEGG